MTYHLEALGGGWVIVDSSGRMASELFRTRSAAEIGLLYLSRDLPATIRTDALATLNGVER